MSKSLKRDRVLVEHGIGIGTLDVDVMYHPLNIHIHLMKNFNKIGRGQK
jgi:hypothetical protein